MVVRLRLRALELRLVLQLAVLALLSCPVNAAVLGASSGQRDCGIASRALPQIVKGSNREMLHQAVKHVQSVGGSAADKAALFEKLVPQITKLSGNSWTATRGLATDGSHVFLGGAGEALIINPAGQLLRGSLQSGVGLGQGGKFVLDFAKLTGL